MEKQTQEWSGARPVRAKEKADEREEGEKKREKKERRQCWRWSLAWRQG